MFTSLLFFYLFSRIFAEQAMYNFPQNVFLNERLICECPASGNFMVWYMLLTVFSWTPPLPNTKWELFRTMFFSLVKFCQTVEALTCDYGMNYLSPLKSMGVKN